MKLISDLFRFGSQSMIDILSLIRIISHYRFQTDIVFLLDRVIVKAHCFFFHILFSYQSPVPQSLSLCNWDTVGIYQKKFLVTATKVAV